MPRTIVLHLPRFPAQPLGEHQYFHYLIQALLEVSPAHNKFVVHTTGLRGYALQRQQISKIAATDTLPLRWSYIPNTLLNRSKPFKDLIPADLYFGENDLVHSFNADAVPKSVKNFVLTCQDLAILRGANGNESSSFCRQIRRLISDAAMRARVIITISDFTKSEIIDLLGIEPAKIVVIKNGVDRTVFHMPTEQEFAEGMALIRQLDLSDGYILCLGGAAKRKNLSALIKAYSLMREKYHVRLPLVVGGSKDLWIDAKESYDKSPYKSHIRLLGYLPQNQMVRLLQSATVLACPSTYEGFGLPVVEAMACGVPVALAKTASLPEIGGDAAIYFDPNEPESIAVELSKFIGDPVTLSGAAKAGLRRSEDFSWHKNARQTLAVYERVLSNRLKETAIPSP